MSSSLYLPTHVGIYCMILSKNYYKCIPPSKSHPDANTLEVFCEALRTSRTKGMKSRPGPTHKHLDHLDSI